MKPGTAESDGQGGVKKFADRDELYEAAIDVVVREGRGSVSLLQRALGIGYGRAARLIDFMAEDGIVGQYNGSQAREVIISLEQWAEMSGSGGVSAAKAAEPRRNNKIMLAPPAERRSTEPRAAADAAAVAVAEEDEEDEELDDSDEPIDDDEETDDANEPETEEDLDEDPDDDPDEYDEAEPAPVADRDAAAYSSRSA